MAIRSIILDDDNSKLIQRIRFRALQLSQLKPCSHWRLHSPNSATIVAGNSDNLSPNSVTVAVLATVAEFGDYSRQCGQGFMLQVLSSVCLSVTLCSVALRLEKLYRRRVPRRGLPIHFFRHFCCTLYGLARKHSERPKS